jgi:hypothetical protein
MEKLGGRKFVFGFLCLVSAFVVLLVKPDMLKNWVDTCGVIGGIYVLGNVASKFSPDKKE